MASQKEKENIFGQQAQFTKVISRMVTNMALENGKKGWGTVLISTKANMFRISAVAMEHSLGDLQELRTEENLKKTL